MCLWELTKLTQLRALIMLELSGGWMSEEDEQNVRQVLAVIARSAKLEV